MALMDRDLCGLAPGRRALQPGAMVSRRAAFTLVEVMFAMCILAMLLSGLVATVVQSRRMTEGSIRRNLATTIAQSYMEQIKRMPISIMANQSNGVAVLGSSYALPIVSNDTGSDTTLMTTTGTPPTLSSLTPGTTPVGEVDNLQDFNPASVSGGNGAATTWSAVWPHAQSAPGATTPYQNDFQENFFVWITDISTNTGQSVYSITMYYSWRVPDGSRVRYYSDQLHAVRSSVASY